MSWSRIRLHKDSVAYGASILMGSSLVLNLLGICYRLILARDLGAQGLALYHLTISFYTILSGIAISGLTTSVSQGAAYLSGSGHSKQIPLLLQRCVFIFFLIYTILLVLALPLSPFLAKTLLGSENHCTLIALLFPYMLLTGIENIYKALFLGLGKTMLPSISEIIEQSIRILLLPQIIWVANAYSPSSRVACLLFTMFLGEIFASSFMLIGYLRHKKTISCGNNQSTSSANINKIILSIAMPTLSSGLCVRIISSGCSIFLPLCLVWSGLNQQDANHIYGTFTGMTMPLLTMCTAITMPLFTAVMPKISKATASGNLSLCRRKCGKLIHITSLIVLPSMAILLLCPKEISMLLYGDPYPGSLCTMFIPCITLSMFAGASTFMLSSMGHNGLSGILTVSSGILQLLNLWLGIVVLKGGLLGYAILETINDLFILSFGITIVCKKCGLKIMWKNWLIKPLCALAPSLLIAFTLFSWLGSLNSPLWLQTILPSVILLCLYVLFLVFAGGLNITRYLSTLLDKKTPELPRV